MKLNISIPLLLFLLIILTSCAKNCLDDDSKFRLRMEVIATEAGQLIVEYSMQDKLSGSAIKSSILKSEEPQFIEFCFTEEPIEFKIYPSEELQGSELTVLNVMLENSERQLFIKEDMVYLYLKESNLVKRGEKTNSFIFSKNNNGVQKPYITSRPSLEQRLKKKLKE